MAKRVAFCLMENDAGQVLLVQRGYGRQKFKWSLPGGNCDRNEPYHRAAIREVREETGLRVEIISLIFEGKNNPIKTYFGKIRSGQLKAQRPECLDAKFFDYNNLPLLAFSADRRALDEWQDMKTTYASLASTPQTPTCTNCGSHETRLRRYPHHNPYRCRSCNRVFSAVDSVTRPANESPNMGQTKEKAVFKIIINHILSERQKLNLIAPEPNAGLTAAAGETAMWFAAEDKFEDKIVEYLTESLAKQTGMESASWILRLAYGRHIWPADVEPSEIANDLIDRVGLSEIVGFRDLDYLAIGSCHAVLDQSGNPVEALTNSKGDQFGYALVVAYASDGNGLIVDRINQRRQRFGAAPLQISVPLRGMTRKFISSFTADEAGAALSHEAQSHGYLTEGWRVRLDYGGSYAKFPTDSKAAESDSGRRTLFVGEPEMAEIIATQLLKDWPTLLRPDWQDIGIATRVKDHPELGGLNFQAEFVLGWRIPFDAERPAHFPPPIDAEGNPSIPTNASDREGGEVGLDNLLGPRYQEAPANPQRRRSWWPFRS